MLFPKSDEKLIRALNDDLTAPVRIRFLETEDPRAPEFRAFCEAFQQIAPKVHFLTEKAATSAPPAIEIRSNWHYHAIPQANELKPFLDVIRMLDRGEPPVAELASARKPHLAPPPVGGAGEGFPGFPDGHELIRNRLREVLLPAGLRIYVTAQCPFCPGVLAELSPLPLINPLIELTVIDGGLFPELAEAERVQAAPTVILDGDFRWTGQVRLEELLEALMHRDPARLDAAALERMIKDGHAAQLARMMLGQAQLFPAFLKLLVHPEWSVRMGAMVVLEEITEGNRGLSGNAAKFLWRNLEHADPAVKGDIVYLLGEVGDAEMAPGLRELLAGSGDDEFREVLEEAIMKLEGA
jgi:hypothetical protein